MARLRYGLWLSLSCVILMGLHSASGGDDTVPYIYYHANIANAIVVERADGTDSRLIAPDAMPRDSTVISDLDWSPSGEWMAWSSGMYNPYGGVIGYSTWIARSDGSNRLTLLDNVGRTLALKWSPIDDLLFVAYLTRNLLVKLAIIDPHANAVIAQTDYQFNYTGTWLEALPNSWMLDGSGIYFTLYLENTTLLGQLSITNQTSNRVYSPPRTPILL